MRKSVISTNNTSKRTLNKANIGNIRSIFPKVGAMVAKALFTVVNTALSGLASGSSENTLTRIVSIKSNILVIRYR